MSHRIRIHEQFSSWKELNECLKSFQKLKKQTFTIRTSKTLNKNPVEGANKDCKYKYLLYKCGRGSNYHGDQGEGIRKTT